MKFLHHCLICACALPLSFSAVSTAAAEGEDRAAAAAVKMQQLFGDDYQPRLQDTDPEFAAIRDNLIYGELFYQGTLDDRMRILVNICGLTAGGFFEQIADYARAGLRLQVDPSAMKEAVIQTAPYSGIYRAEKTLGILNEVFREAGIPLPLPPQATVTEENRFQAGQQTQLSMYGERMQTMWDTTPPGQQTLQVQHLSAYCFGDVFMRGGLSAAERELLLWSAILTIGGADAQVRSHAVGNINIGNSKQNLIDVIALLMPQNGFPRSLNALAAVNQAVPEPESAE